MNSVNRKKDTVGGETLLHGNRARIEPPKSISPMFADMVINDYRDDRYGRAFHRLESDADFSKEDVDSIRL